MKFSTPYYLAGRSADRWHRQEGMHSFKKGAIMAGAGAAAVKWPQETQRLASDRLGIILAPQQVKGAGAIMAGAGALRIAHGAYHYGRAAAYEKNLKKMNRGVGARKVGIKETADKVAASNSAEYRNRKRKKKV